MLYPEYPKKRNINWWRHFGWRDISYYYYFYCYKREILKKLISPYFIQKKSGAYFILKSCIFHICTNAATVVDLLCPSAHILTLQHCGITWEAHTGMYIITYVSIVSIPRILWIWEKNRLSDPFTDKQQILA